MRIIETKVYPFAELSDEAKQKAIENLYDINVDHEWWDGVYEDAKNIGLKITSFELDRNRNATGEFLYAANEVAQDIFKNHGESCETFKTATKFMEQWQPLFSNYMDENSENYENDEELMECEEQFLNDLLEDCSVMLQKGCEYLQSAEAIKETIEANEYEFTEDGKLI